MLEARVKYHGSIPWVIDLEMFETSSALEEFIEILRVEATGMQSDRCDIRGWGQNQSIGFAHGIEMKESRGFDRGDGGEVVDPQIVWIRDEGGV